MNLADNLRIEEVENYLNRIFDLQSKLIDKDFKIALLEFELKIERQSHEFVKKLYLPAQKHKA